MLMSNRKVKDVRYHVFKDYSAEITGESDEEIAEKMRNNPELEALRYSFVSLCTHPGRGSIFCGMTNRAHDLLLEFTIASGEFRSCGYAEMAIEQEAKIHRGLWLDEEDDALYLPHTGQHGGLENGTAAKRSFCLGYFCSGFGEIVAFDIPFGSANQGSGVFAFLCLGLCRFALVVIFGCGGGFSRFGLLRPGKSYQNCNQYVDSHLSSPTLQR